MHGSHGVDAIFESHPRDGHTLVLQGTAVVIEDKVEILLVLVQNHGKVAVPAGEKPVTGAAIQGIAGGENNTEVTKRATTVVGN